MSAAMNLQAQEGVVLLHGMCRTAESMQKMETSLRQAGFSVLNADYPSRTALVEALSDAAIGQALANPALKDCVKIHFVTHSLGGILVRSYFKRHVEPRLGRVVMLGPPNQGSEVVDELGSWWMFRKLNGPAGGELGTGANSTPNKLGPVNFELGVIAGDRSINWINSCMITGSDDGKVSVERTKVAGMKDHVVVHATHPFLMKDKMAIDYTIRFLKTGTFGEVRVK
ncbi:MAG: alpha/beta hydrolase [Verrucomicrobia bacterium]|nr:alpha/beta hydrolase [Verrucomicrobiota bacterium]